MKIKIKDPVSGFLHLAGALLSIVGLYFLIRYALDNGTVWHIVSFSIFGASLILLYTASIQKRIAEKIIDDYLTKK